MTVRNGTATSLPDEVLERAGNAIAAVLCECCTVEEIEDTLAQINPADWKRAAEAVLEIAGHAEVVQQLEEMRAELRAAEQVLVAADRVREAYEAMEEGRDLGSLPDWTMRS